jgi:hypothetical protein
MVRPSRCPAPSIRHKLQGIAHFRAKWPNALELALAVYPNARIEDAGVLLKPPGTPVAPKLIAAR